MKQPYLYFQRKGYYAVAGIADGDYSGTAVTSANAFMLPADVNATTASPSLQLTHRAVDAQTNKRSALVIAAGPRPGTPVFSATPANIVAGEVSILDNATSYFIDGTNELNVHDLSTDGGLTVTTNDFLYLEEISFSAEVLPFTTTGADICLPASSYICAEPLGFTAGGGIHWDGTALDATRLRFLPLSPEGGGGVETVIILHTADKFLEVSQAMAELCNSSVYDEAIKVHQLTASGQILHKAFSSRGIRVYGVRIA